MRIQPLIGVLCFALPLALPAQADHHGADMSIGVTAGSLGFGAEVSKWLVPHIGVRGGINFFTLHSSITQTDISYKATLKMKAIEGLIDLYPSARGSFRVSAGIMTDPLEVTATGQPQSDGTYTINGNDYTSAQVGTLTGSAKWPKSSPYVGLGFGTPANKHMGIKFTTDFGVAIGKPTIALTSTGAASNAQLQSDLDAQVAKSQKDVNKYAKVYPVISAGLMLRF